MKEERKFIRIITTDDNEVIIAIDAINSVQRDNAMGIVTLKDGAIYKVRVLNSILDAIEKYILKTDQPEPEKEEDNYKVNILNDYGISVQSQPQFVNFIKTDSNILINASTIKKIETKDEIQTAITLIDASEPIILACNIRDLVEVLANVIPVDAGGL